MNMRIMSTRTHGIIDYIEGPTLMAVPELFKLKGVRAAALVPRIAGGGSATYSALTDYELGIRKVLPMKTHLALDLGAGVLLAASPWIFGFAKAGRRYWLPHTLVGGGKVLAALTTKTQPPYKEQAA